jgi:hypothetical protein
MGKDLVWGRTKKEEAVASQFAPEKMGGTAFGSPITN